MILLVILLCCPSCRVTREYRFGPSVREMWEDKYNDLPFTMYTNQVYQRMQEYKKQDADAFAPVDDIVRNYTNRVAQIVQEYKRQHPDSPDPITADEIHKLIEFTESYETPLFFSKGEVPSDYRVIIGMHKHTLHVLYGKPTRVRVNPEQFAADEVYIYDTATGQRWTYFIKDDKVTKIQLTYVEAF